MQRPIIEVKPEQIQALKLANLNGLRSLNDCGKDISKATKTLAESMVDLTLKK